MVQAKSSGSNGLHELGYKIFLDRYAQKDMTRQSLTVGDTVIVVVDSKTGQREIGKVKTMNLPDVTVELLHGDTVTRPLEQVDKPLETDPAQMMDRVAAGIANAEATPELRETWRERFRWLLDDWKFVPAGRILTAAGTDQELTFYNCYVINSPTDSRGGIIETLHQMTEIMSRGGGVGMNLSSLRPRHSYVQGVNGRSSGSVSWGALYSFVTGLIEQGGCFGPDERILTSAGLIPAAALADRMDDGETFYAQTHRGLRQMTARFRNGVKPLYEVTTRRGYRVRITKDHKVAVLLDGEITTMPLEYLVEGDDILLLAGEGVETDYVPLNDQPKASNRAVTLPEVLDEDLAYLLGYMHGDESVEDGNAIKMATANANPQIRERIVDLVRSVFGLVPTINAGDGDCTDVVVDSPSATEWLTRNDLLNTERTRVPEAIFRSPSSVMAAFIAGYFDADGHNRARKGGYGFDSISRAMLEDVQQLLAINGIMSSISATDRSHLGWQTIYHLTVTDDTFEQRFAEFVPTAKVIDGASERIAVGQVAHVGEVATAKRSNETLRTMPDEIVSIEPIGDSQVYDFEVDDVHLLSGSGVYTSNSRRGALMLILDDWHPDIFDFINSKREMGQITNANISVNVSDKLMEAVKADADWELVFPDTSHPDYDEVWDGDLGVWRDSGRPVVHYRTVKAREVWNAIIESAWASAEPGIWFGERSNKMSNSWYFNPLIATNPCVTGDTLVYTADGLMRAEELFDDERDVEVVLDGRFGHEPVTTKASRVFMTGTKPVYRLQTKEGYYLRATADHRIMTARGWVEMRDLRPGDEIHILNRKGGFGQEGTLELGQLLGRLAADETLMEEAAVLSSVGAQKREPVQVSAGHGDDSVAPSTVRSRNHAVGAAGQVDPARRQLMAVEHGLTETKHRVPEAVFTGSEDMQRGFLQALFTTDGRFVDAGEQGASVRLAANQRELLEGVQQLLLNFGIASRIDREPQGELIISQANVVTFAVEIGFMPSGTNEKLQSYRMINTRAPRQEHFTAQFESCEEDGVEAVFDLTEPLTHSFVSNGVVIHNCGEQSLAGWSVCNLGAINLSRFYNSEQHDVDWSTLDQAVRYATRFLDNVIEVTPYFFGENEEQQKGERRVGLNNMGLAELMIRLGIRYGSPESERFIDRLYGFIARASYETSVELAQEKGAFPRFDSEKFVESGFMQTMPVDIREKVRNNGIRNVTLLTQAPTGTTGTMVNTSTGIEPFFSWVYFRKSRLGLAEEHVPLVKDWLEANPGKTVDDLPDYYVTAMQLAPEEHVRVQAAIQRWVDSSISKTANLPSEYTVEQTRELYELMHELGCKGGTVYRDGSRDEQVLMLKDDDRAKKDMESIAEATGGASTERDAEVAQVATPHRVYPRPKMLSGVTVNVQTPFGGAYITMNSDESGNPFEVFITAPGKAGSDLQADAEGLGRLISLQLRAVAPQNRIQMLRLVIDQLQGIGGSRSVGMGPNRVMSLPDAVAGALWDHYFAEKEEVVQLPLLADEAPAPQRKKTTDQIELYADGSEEIGIIEGADMCPSCHTIAFIRAEGCRKCLNCGYAEC